MNLTKNEYVAWFSSKYYAEEKKTFNSSECMIQFLISFCERSR